MSIRIKIVRALRLATFLTVLTGIISFGIIKTIDSMYSETVNRGMPQIEQQHLIEKYIIEEAKYVQLYLLGHTESLDEYSNVQQNLSQTVQGLEQLFTESSAKEQLKNLNQQIIAYETQLAEVITLYEGNRYKRAVDLLNNEVIASQRQIEQASATFTKETKNSFIEVTNHVSSLALYSIIALVFILVLSLIIGQTTSRKLNKDVSTPIEQLKIGFEQLQNGQLTYELPHFNTNNEISSLANSFKIMQSQLTSFIQTVQQNAKNLNNISSNLVHITTDVNHTSSTIAANTQIAAETIIQISNATKESSESVDQTAMSLKNIAASTENMLHRITRATKQATEGSTQIQQVNEQMTQIQHSTETTNELIKKFTIQSKEIESFSKIITQITEQTNLLALNASIEAARAGEHGKGFAVVANEVRALADQSKNASEKIAQLTNEILKDTRNIEKAIRLNLHNVESGVAQLKVADITFNTIVADVVDLEQQTKLIYSETDLISVTSIQLASAMNAITDKIDEITAQMQEISASTSMQAGSITTISNASVQLSDCANELEQQLQHFKL